MLDFFLTVSLPPSDYAAAARADVAYGVLCESVRDRSLTDREVCCELESHPLLYMNVRNPDGSRSQELLEALSAGGYFRSLDYWLKLNHEDVTPAVLCNLMGFVRRTKHVREENSPNGKYAQVAQVTDSNGGKNVAVFLVRFYSQNDKLYVVVEVDGSKECLRLEAGKKHKDRFPEAYAVFKKAYAVHMAARAMVHKAYEAYRYKVENKLMDPENVNYFQLHAALCDTPDLLHKEVLKQCIPCMHYTEDKWCCSRHRGVAMEVQRRCLPSTPTKRKRRRSSTSDAPEKKQCLFTGSPSEACAAETPQPRLLHLKV